ncbi:MAG: pyrroline-5-carboxylate reductase [Proteobacteria bacterium]|nr:pyrroline-5-carboxylate reductase [Pseudomonadota bacterium]
MDKVGIVGLGNMGEAIAKNLLKSGAKKDSILCFEIKPERRRFIEEKYKLKFTGSAEELIKKVRYIILSIKPQDADKLLNSITSLLDDKKIIISIMAGITLSNILSTVGKPIKAIRIMPNICVKVGEGAIGIAPGSYVNKEEIDAVKALILPMGRIIEVGEELMDAVTALGGSGPAFFLLFLESMIDAGVKIGIARDKSKAICSQVVRGTLKMLEEEDVHPTLMKEMITSPAGTTIAGLAILEESAFKGNIIKAVEISAKRAKELSL